MPNQTVFMKAKTIQLLAMDVDGVLTNGKISLINQQEIKHFHAHDGLGMKLLQKTGVHIAIVTARRSPAITQRMNELGIQKVLQGQTNKHKSIQKLKKDMDLDKQHIAYIGDDLPDLSAMQYVGLGIAVSNASTLIKPYADWVTHRKGGEGAVREVCELIMRAQNTLDPICQSYHV